MAATRANLLVFPAEDMKALPMTIFDFSHLTAQQRLELIGELWDSIEAEDIPLSPEQVAELDRRYATLDQDIKEGRDAFAIYDDLTARYR